MKRFLAFVAAYLVCAPVLAAEPTADDYIRFFKPLAGDFTVKAKIGDKEFEATSSAKLLADKKCFVVTGSEVPPYPAFTSIDGYDPAAKKWKSTGYSTEGELWVTYLSASAESLKGRKNVALDAEQTQIKADGSIVKWKSKWTYTFAADKVVVTTTEQTRNGEKTPDEEWVYTPKK